MQPTHVKINSRVAIEPGTLLRIEKREPIVRFDGGGVAAQEFDDAEYVCDLGSISALELGGGTLTLTYASGECNEFTLTPDSTIEIGGQAVPLANVVEIELASEAEPVQT